MIITLVTILHVLICFFLVIVVLLQSGKAGDIASAFGGMGTQTAFGPRGSATVLSKATTVAAALFMMTSLTLAIFASRRAGSASTVLDRHPAPQSAPAPEVPPPDRRPSVTVYDEATGAKKTVPLPLPAQGQAGQQGGSQSSEQGQNPAK